MFRIGYRANFSQVQRGASQLAKRLEADLLRPLYPSAAYVRSIAIRSIKVRSTPSSPGQPPHSKTKRFPKSILFDVDRRRGVAVVGPLYSRVGPSASEHEKGGFSRGQKFPQRAFMQPALDRSQDKIAGFFERS